MIDMQIKTAESKRKAGRPPAPPRPTPISWRPQAAAQAEKFKNLGGAKWLRRMIDQATPEKLKNGPV